MTLLKVACNCSSTTRSSWTVSDLLGFLDPSTSFISLAAWIGRALARFWGDSCCPSCHPGSTSDPNRQNMTSDQWVRGVPRFMDAAACKRSTRRGGAQGQGKVSIPGKPLFAGSRLNRLGLLTQLTSLSSATCSKPKTPSFQKAALFCSAPKTACEPSTRVFLR